MVMHKVVPMMGALGRDGEGIARELTAAGATLKLGARRIERLDALADEVRLCGASVETRRLDVTDRADVTAFAEAVRAASGKADAIGNDAGIMPPDHKEPSDRGAL